MSPGAIPPHPPGAPSQTASPSEVGRTISPDILAALTRGSTVLTPNQRAARSLRHAYDHHRLTQGDTLWSPPPIFALDTWLSTLWSQLLLDGAETALLLNHTQEHALWRNIIVADREVPGLRSPDSLAEMAARAWHQLCLHNGRPRLHEFTVTTDARAFARWAHHFERLCTRNLYLSQSQLPAALEAALARGDLSVPNAGLTLVDFDTIPPAPSQFFDSLQFAGYPVDHLTTSVPTHAANLYPAPDDPSELRAAATWARRHLDINPQARIAIVVPALAERRAAIERVFASILAPELQPITASSPLPFEFSLGQPLDQTALVAAALDLLRWPLEALPFERISALLLSPFFGASTGTAETLAAAEFDALDLRHRETLRPELTLDALLHRLRASRQIASLETLHARLTAIRRTALAGNLTPSVSAALQQSHAQWSEAFRNLLNASGLPLAAASSSLAFQLYRRWESVLDELATLDFNAARPNAQAALEALTRIAHQTIFAPESRLAPVQILGPLELGGVPFDALWFLAADDSSWPPPAPKQPLIPWHLQRELAMPAANPARHAATAQALTHRIANSAAEVVFSFAAHTEDGERRPSPLLRPLNLTELSVDPPSITAPLPLELIPDTTPLPPLPDAVLSGGARVLELQAACAFRAFAELRLSSTPLDTRQPGLDPRERGSLVHRIMQAFWTEIQSQYALRDLTLQQRESFLDRCIAEALQTPGPNPWDNAYLEVQRLRLRSLLRPWLAFELERPAFTVLHREEESPARIGPLKLTLRVDRIDRTDAGTLIIDYKTGPATPGDWLGDRPDAPQLPLYAVLAESADLGGVAFALLRPGEDLCLKGYADNLAVLATPTPPERPLPDQLEDWYRVLTDLATAFAEGDAAVAPKCYPKTCGRCAQRVLCRLDPTTLEDTSDPDTDQDAPADPATSELTYG